MKKLISGVTLFTVLTILTAVPTQAAGYSNYTCGSDQATIKIEVFNDFQCPYCARLNQTLYSGGILRKVAFNDLQITFKDFPLSFHKNAEIAARAANAFLSIDDYQYPGFVNFLFRTQKQWSESDKAYEFFAARAKKMGVDPNAFKKAFDDPKNLEEIKQDIAEGTERGISGTPSYFINGKIYSGAVPLPRLLEYIKAAK